MSTSTDEITLDIDALDAAAAAKSAEKDKKSANGADPNGIVVENSDPEPVAPVKTVVTPEQGLEKLQKQLADEKSARIAAENRANESAQAEARARGEVQTSQLDLVTGAIERITQSSDALEAKYAEALTAQDFPAAAKIQREMASNAAKLLQLENGKTALEKAPKPVPRAPTDPVEQFAAQLSPQSAAWVRAHPEFVRDGHKNQQMLAAHQLALARGHKVDTPEYFGNIEKTLDITQPKVDPTPADDQEDPMADAARPANGGRSAAPAAPVSRSGNGAGAKAGRVTLTPDQIEAAHASFPDSKTPLEDYARQVVALKKEGKLS